jgi:hypothetical protein
MAKVYVSSTLVDLVDERALVMDWLVTARHQPVHSYLPDSETVRESCLQDVGECDLYVLILGHRYGCRPERENPEQLSITHLEFRRAGKCRLPRIALLRTSDPDVRLFDLLAADQAAKLKAFIDEVRLEVRPGQFCNREELLKGLSTGVQHALERLREAPEVALDQVRRRLAQGDNIGAERVCMDVLREHPDQFDAHLLMAIAILGSSAADRLSSTALRRVESHLRLVAEKADIATAWAIWGIIRFDAYRINNLAMGEPGPNVIRRHLERLGRDNLDHDLLKLISRTRDADRYFALATQDTSGE